MSSRSRSALTSSGRTALLLSLLIAGAAPAFAAGGGFLIDPVTGAFGSFSIQGIVYVSIPDGSGGFYVGGDIGMVGGQTRTNAAHILADGTVDAWNPAPNRPVTSLCKAGSTVYLGGTFSQVSGVARGGLAAVDATTGALRGWAPSVDAQVQAIAQIGSRVFIGGGFCHVNGVSHCNLAALDSATGALLSIPIGRDHEVYALAVRDTELFLGGEFIGHLAAISPTTGAPTRTLPQPNGYVWTIAVDGNDLYVTGGFSFCGPSSRVGLAAVDLGSNTVEPWDPGCGATGVAVSGTAVYLATGATLAGGANRIGFARIDRQTGRALPGAPAFNTLSVSTISVGSQWVFLGGSNGSPNSLTGSARPLVARLPQVNGPIYATLFAGDTLFIGGSFSRIGRLEPAATPWVARQGIAAIRWSTGEVLDWSCPVVGTVNAIVPYGNRLIVGGEFTSAGGSTHRRMVAIDRTTGGADPWDPALDAAVAEMKLVGDKLYVCGAFAHAMNQVRNCVCAFSLPDLSLTPWDPNVYLGPVYAIESVGDHVYIGGQIASVHGLTRYALAEVDTVTGLPSAWAPVIGGTVHTIVSHQGALFIAGYLSPVEGKGRGSGAAFTLPDHTLLPWDPGANNVIITMKPYLGGMLLGGEFSVLSGTSQSRLGWVDLATGASYPPLGLLPGGPIEAIGTRDAMLMVGGGFVVINGGADQGWFAVTDAPIVPTAVSGGSDLPSAIHVVPSPSPGMPEISWSTALHEPAEITVSDIAGRRVFAARLAPGAQRVRPGVTVEPGIYFVQIRTATERRTARFAVVR